MLKRRYGVIDKKGVFKVKTDRYMQNTFLLSCLDIKSPKEKSDVVHKFVDVYNIAYKYSCGLDGNVAIGLRDNNKCLCVWEMSNKENTYKEFVI